MRTLPSLALVAAVLLCACGSNLTPQQQEQLKQHQESAQQWFDSGQLDRSADQWQRVLNLDPENMRALIGYAMCTVASQNYTIESGAQAAERAIQIEDDDPFVYLVHGIVHFELGRRLNRQAMTKEQLADSYGRTNSGSAEAVERADAYIKEAKEVRTQCMNALQKAAGSLADADELYGKQADQNGFLLRTAALVHAELAFAKMALGVRAEATGDTDLATSLRDEGIAAYLEAAEWMGRNNRAQVRTREQYIGWMEQNRPKMNDVALQQAKDGLENLKSAEIKARTFRAFLLYSTGDPVRIDEGIGELKQVMALNPDSPNAYLSMAMGLSQQGKYKNAANALRKYLHANTRSVKHTPEVLEGLRRGGNLTPTLPDGAP